VSATVSAAGSDGVRPTDDQGGPGRGGFGAWFAGLGRGQRAGVLVVAGVVALNLGVVSVRSLVGGGDPGGPVSSSFSTGDQGMEAYADLLAGAGRTVARQRDRVGRSDLPEGATVVVADPEELAEPEVSAIVAHVRGGGRLVALGAGSEPLVQALLGPDVRHEVGRPVRRLEVWVPVPDVGPARSLAGDAGGRWAGPVGLPVAGSGDRPSVVVADVGNGRVVAVADAGPLRNDHLAEADDAAFGLAVAGGGDRPVVFVESAHGFAVQGWDAVPPSWKWALAGLVVALAAGVWWAASRLGPPEPERRELRPPRVDHVEAVAAGLDRVTLDLAEVTAPLAASARADLAVLLGEPADASAAVLHAAADRAGVDPHVVELLVTPPVDLDSALAVGSLAAARQRAALGVADPGTVAATSRPPDPEPARPDPPDPGATS
jgi:hypothetical protein